MNIRNIIAALALLGLTGAGANAQNRYVSQEAATVLGSDKYYISMAGEQSGGGMTVDFVMEAAGAVCLPAAGYRFGYDGNTTIFSEGSGFYWYSTPNDYRNASTLYFNSGYVFPASNYIRNYAYAVRLVTECQSEPRAE